MYCGPGKCGDSIHSAVQVDFVPDKWRNITLELYNFHWFWYYINNVVKVIPANVGADGPKKSIRPNAMHVAYMQITLPFSNVSNFVWIWFAMI